MSLFLKECRNILKTYIYYVFIAVTILFYISQMGITTSEDLKTLLSPPTKIDLTTEYAPYGEKESTMSKEIMPKVAGNLYREYEENEYITYPIGFYKVIKLDDDETKKIEAILEEIIGQPIEAIKLLWEESSSGYLSISKDMTLDRFNNLMISIDKILGGGSAYGEDFIDRFTSIPITYEEAVEEYEYMIQKDKLTNGYARLFCDYMGIVIGIFPIFVVVSTAIKDKRSKMEELVYFRETSSLKLVLSRYFSLVFMMILPIIILGIKETITFISFANTENLSVDLFAFVKYIVWWILPTLMIVTAIGMFLTTLTDTPVAIAVELFIWFFNINNIQLTGDYPLLGLFVRHNNRGKGMLIAENFSKIMTNRLAIAALALLIVIVTVFIYEQKRRGKLGVRRKMGKWFSFNKNKPKVKYTA